MAYDKMHRSFTCFCGAGLMVAEWAEHDTWPSAPNQISWHFECTVCANERTFYQHDGTQYALWKRDAEEHRGLLAKHEHRREMLYRIAAPKYEQGWVDFVLSLPSKAAMHRAIGERSYSAFLKDAKTHEALQQRIRSRFQAHPTECLSKMRTDDAQFDESTAALNAAEIMVNRCWNEIDKRLLPFHRFPRPPMLIKIRKKDREAIMAALADKVRPAEVIQRQNARNRFVSQ